MQIDWHSMLQSVKELRPKLRLLLKMPGCMLQLAQLPTAVKALPELPAK
jgi:hypothetical protein